MPDERADDVLARLADTIAARRGGDPGASYVAALFARGDDAILKKIGEEATETVMAAKDGDKIRICAEVADLWFHCLVLLARHDLRPADVIAELARREGTSGHAEKAARRPPQASPAQAVRGREQDPS
jgi:phosphoribosyl-ATP pyrophosphohydrolase